MKKVMYCSNKKKKKITFKKNKSIGGFSLDLPCLNICSFLFKFHITHKNERVTYIEALLIYIVVTKTINKLNRNLKYSSNMYV